MSEDAKPGLLPCPFCGGAAVVETISLPSGRPLRYSVGCNDENCIGYQAMTTYARKAEATAAWNRRCPAPPTDTTGLVERLHYTRGALIWTDGNGKELPNVKEVEAALIAAADALQSLSLRSPSPEVRE